ncbi:hypothetical protein H2204_008468 [Knufia peltigerae]|uniref:Uncharacterized protein n=1 Tax=Knufia peltigerae TaxID=1002370 RepID=A0AA38XZZ1_9EURO|nr:hypothetical protein H2204_008468 [Knufia peltigerae]
MGCRANNPRSAEFGDSTQDNGIEGEIFVSYKELYECLQEPEDCIESEKLEARERHQNNFTEADEAVYTEAEERVANRLELDDGSFSGSY